MRIKLDHFRTNNGIATAALAVAFGALAAAAATAQRCTVIELVPGQLPAAMEGYAYEQAIEAAGGSPPYRFAVTAGQLPEGLVLSSEGNLSGTPMVRTGSAFTITATDAAGCDGSRPFWLVVCWPMEVLPPTLSDGVQGRPYRQTLIAHGVSSPTLFNVTGTLPPGLSLRFLGGNTSELSGTPVIAGSYMFRVEAGDGGCRFERSYVLRILGGPVPFLLEGE